MGKENDVGRRSTGARPEARTVRRTDIPEQGPPTALPSGGDHPCRISQRAKHLYPPLTGRRQRVNRTRSHRHARRASRPRHQAVARHREVWLQRVELEHGRALTSLTFANLYALLREKLKKSRDRALHRPGKMVDETSRMCARSGRFRAARACIGRFFMSRGHRRQVAHIEHRPPVQRGNVSK